MDSSQTLNAGNSMCSFQPDLKPKLKELRFRKAKVTAAIIIKIDSKNDSVVIDEELDDCTLEEICDELPDTQPRYVIYSHVRKHDDGRISYPLCFFYYCPRGGIPGLGMRYAGMLTEMQNLCDVNKVFSLEEKEELTDEWLEGKLAKK